METIMKSRTKLFGGTMASVLTLAGVLLSGTGQKAAAQNKEQSPEALAAANPRIEGTWRVTVTQKVCATGAPIGLPFQSLTTFASGGTLSGTTASTSYQPGQRSNDFGVWSQTDSHDYSAVSEAFIIFSAGFFTQGSQIISQSIRLTNGGNGFDDVASVQFYDVNGNPLLPSPGCATAIGTRLQ